MPAMDRDDVRVEVAFVVRVSRDEHGRLRGVVERIKTGQKQRFTGAESLGPLIDSMVGARDRSGSR